MTRSMGSSAMPLSRCAMGAHAGRTSFSTTLVVRSPASPWASAWIETGAGNFGTRFMVDFGAGGACGNGCVQQWLERWGRTA